MKQTKITLSLVAAAVMLTACGQAQIAAPVGQVAASSKDRPAMAAKNGLAAAKAEIVVMTDSAQAPSVADAKAIDSFSFKGTTYHLMTVSSKSAIQKVLGAVRGQKGVRTADANPMMYALGGAPDDEFYSMQYGMQQKQVPDAWRATKGDPNMIVAVIDTGVDYTHPDLKERVILGQDFTFRPGWIFNRKDKDGPMDDNAHGTHCAGIIGAIANNGVGIAGVAPDSKIMAVKVLGGEGGGSQYDVMKGVAYAVTNGAKVINMSLGGTATTSVERKFYEAAVASGALIVAAAGNSADGLGFPAAYPGILSVGATDSGGNLARFSNHDETMSVTAPGVGILSTIPGNTYAKFSGTSMAAPFVSGVAALVWSAHPEWTAEQVKSHIERTATDKGAPGVDSLYGHGEVNVQAALGQGK
ncbi:Thermophilic serine proteinase precursor [compost metagenome]